eukprot:1121034-Amphidinium_carterae.1
MGERTGSCFVFRNSGISMQFAHFQHEELRTLDSVQRAHLAIALRQNSTPRFNGAILIPFLRMWSRQRLSQKFAAVSYCRIILILFV